MTDDTSPFDCPVADLRVLVHRLQLAANAAALLRSETAELREVLRRRRLSERGTMRSEAA